MKSTNFFLVTLASIFFLNNCGSKSNNDSVNNKDSLAINENNISLLIESKTAGQIQIGQIIGKIVIPDSQKLTTKKNSRNGEEGEVIEETVNTLAENGEEMLKIIGENNIDEIYVVSPKYKTKDGIGVGSSVKEFMSAYPDGEILFSYIAGNFWLETKSVDVQFLLDIEDYTGAEDKLMDGDMVKIDIKQLKEGTKIKKIRIY